MRKPNYLSPATDKITFIVDGTPVVVDQAVANFNNAGPSGDGTFTFGVGESVKISFATTPGQSYFTINAAFTVTPGTHKLGAVILSGTPAFVLSEGQRSYVFNPGPNDFSAQPLALKGVVATGYVECDTAAQNLDTTGTCSSYANFNAATSTYAFTAVAADYDGFPVAYQEVTPGNALPFDNGGFTVVESPSDSPAILQVSASTWANPGNHITGPSGGWIPGSNFVYGQPFTVKCLGIGTGHISLQLNGNGGSFDTPTGSPDVGTYDAVNNPNGKYPPAAVANGILPLGSKTSVASPRLPIVNVTVYCSSTGTISLI
jgi:hypothetical protein